MHPFLIDIRSVGFDLDQTLYPPKKEIDDVIRNEIARHILLRKPELENVEKVRIIYDSEFKKTESWTKILREIGFENPEKIMYQCISNPLVLDYIEKDEKLVRIIDEISRRYFIFLITNSPKNLSVQKLKKIGINPELFKCRIFGDDIGFTSKTDAKVFTDFLQNSPYYPQQHIYVGDSLKSDIIIPKSLGMKTISVGKEIQEATFSVMNIHEISELLL